MDDKAGIIWLKLTDSTNDEARMRLDALDNLSVLAAETQTAGRGQGDHTWTSAPRQNLTFTLVLKFPPCAPIATSEILLITQAVTGGIRRYLLSKGVESRIKWPNDIYVGDRKICGILIENILDGKQVSSSMIGIGLNLNQDRFPADLPNPVSLRQLTGRTYDLRTELVLLRDALKKTASLLDSQEGRSELSRDFDAFVFRKED